MNFMNLFTKKNKALEDARGLLKAAQIGQLKAQQDLDWAESMRIYHKLREESLVEFIDRLERIEAPRPTAEGVQVSVSTRTFGESILPARATRHPRKYAAGGLVDPTPQAA